LTDVNTGRELQADESEGLGFGCAEAAQSAPGNASDGGPIAPDRRPLSLGIGSQGELSSTSSNRTVVLLPCSCNTTLTLHAFAGAFAELV
jgi:hypothetical protein